MTDDRPDVLHVRATIAVADLDEALVFWTGVAGFDVEVTMGEPPMFAMLTRGPASLAVVCEDDPPVIGFCPAFVTVADLETVLTRLDAASIPLEQGPTTRPWGIRDVVVRCPGGGPLIAFGEQLDPDT